MTTRKSDIDFLLALAFFRGFVTGKSEFVLARQFFLNFHVA